MRPSKLGVEMLRESIAKKDRRIRKLEKLLREFWTASLLNGEPGVDPKLYKESFEKVELEACRLHRRWRKGQKEWKWWPQK